MNDHVEVDAAVVEPWHVQHYRRWRGKVLAIGEENYHDDSDFYIVVWDEDAGEVRRESDGTTRFAAPAQFHAADATLEVIAKAEAWMRTKFLPEFARNQMEAERRRIVLGSWVKVVRGRKLPIGTGGHVFWMGRGFRRGQPDRVGFQAYDGERSFTSLDNLERIDVAPVTDEDLKPHIDRHARNWRLVGWSGRLPLV